MRDLVEQTKEILKRTGLVVRKELGQNFLIDQKVLENMVTAANLSGQDLVLEIGPGLGFLTQALAKKAGRVLAVELDPQLAKIADRKTRALGNVAVVQGNILFWDWAARVREIQTESSALENFKIVASLPYYLTSPVITQILTSSQKAASMVLLVQREVAERLVENSSDRSFLTVFVEFWTKARLVAKVSRQSFWPVPQMDSAIVRLETRRRPPLPRTEIRPFMRLVKMAFANRRKQLVNALGASFALTKETTLKWLVASNIDSTRRAETLTLAEWLKLFRKRPAAVDKPKQKIKNQKRK